MSSKFRRIKRIFLGYLCLLLGIIGGFIPILQGWIFIILGSILLKDHLKMSAKIIDYLKEKYPEQGKKAENFENRLDQWLKKVGF